MARRSSFPSAPFTRDPPFTDYGIEAAEGGWGASPLKLFSYILQYRWVVAAFSIAGLAVGMALTMMQTPLYQATARVEILVPSAKVFEDIEVISETSDLRAFITAREKLSSRGMAQRVVHELRLRDNSDFLNPSRDFSIINLMNRVAGRNVGRGADQWTAEQREAAAIAGVLRGLSAELIPGTSLLSITFRDANPALARDIANQTAQSFIDQRLDRTSATSDLARQFIESQVTHVKEKLRESEQALVDYAKTAGITITGNDQSLIAANIIALNTALATAIQERLDTGRVVDQIQGGQGGRLRQVVESEGLAKVRERIMELTGVYQQKLEILQPNFPEMRQLKAQIETLQMLMNQGILAILDAVRLRFKEATNKEIDLRKKLSEMEQQNVHFNDKNIHYTILKRDVESNRSLYQSLISKLNEISVSAELKTQNAAIVDLAVLPSAPFSPNLLSNLFTALAVFGIAAAATIYLLEISNNTFSSPAQVELILGLPILGAIPMVAEKQLHDQLEDQTSNLSEAYRSLRTSLQSSGSQGTPRTLLVTSAEPSEGKSTSVYKLAQDFAILDLKVLVIDADFRKPSLHRLFGLGNLQGLSNLIASDGENKDPAAVMQATKHKSVMLLSAGAAGFSPADLLCSPRLAALLSTFSKQFDMIIIDAPPIVDLSDALILGRLAEGTLMVVSAHQVARKSAKSALRRIQLAGAHVLGAAVSKMAVEESHYNYYSRQSHSETADNNGHRTPENPGGTTLPALESPLHKDEQS
ncbi:capsular exopolysaccharide synthesis family protein [Rhodoligotrophos appendicifer]|uniref:GumC family protein n=1 Tax=Rhodoligotrophos appendicifer TaxID=987056 RepID=UPI0014793D3B|nr:polysaccharide biosynthesis tyrosine autokinase [Rhodoligotrophos appendicifer]